MCCVWLLIYRMHKLTPTVDQMSRHSTPVPLSKLPRLMESTPPNDMHYSSELISPTRTISTQGTSIEHHDIKETSLKVGCFVGFLHPA